jgi:hypothetical protein
MVDADPSSQEESESEEVDLVPYNHSSSRVIVDHDARVRRNERMENSNPDRFKNQLAEGDKAGKKRFELLLAAWYDTNGEHQVIPSGDYQRLVDQAIKEQADSVGSRSSRKGRTSSGYAVMDHNEDGDERQFAKAMQASMTSNH